jgi:antitoxin component HigA of HigAB toxin-antitoxin module
MKTIDILNKYKSDTASKWREEAEYRRRNARWLRYSAMISLKVRDRMSQIGMTQVVLAERLGCTQQHISMLLKGKNNLTLETIAKLEEALDFNIIGESIIPANGYKESTAQSHHTYLSEAESVPYGKNK